MDEEDANTDDNYVEKYTEMFARLAKTKGKLALPYLFLQHRSDILQDFAMLVGRLNDNKHRGNAGVGRVMLGSKGTGKSTFIQSFAIATPTIFPNVTVVFVDFARVDQTTRVLPSQMLFYAMKTVLKQMGDCNDTIDVDDLQV